MFKYYHMQDLIYQEDRESGIRFVRKPQALSNPRRHFHDSWEILYLAEGRRTLFYKTRTYTMQPGSIILIPPGVLHRGINKGKTTCDLYTIYFLDMHNKLFSPIKNLAKTWTTLSEPIITLDEKERYEVSSLLLSISEEIAAQKTGYAEQIYSTITTILVKSLRYNNTKKATGPEQNIDSRIAGLIKWLENNYHQKIDLSKAASISNISPTHLSRLFYKNTSLQFSKYLTYIRIQHACEMLATTTLPVYRIAEKCGFGSIAQFGRAFKNLTGKTPIQYRKTTSIIKTERLARSP